MHTSLGPPVSALLSVSRRGALARASVLAYSTLNSSRTLWDPGCVPAAAWAWLENPGVEGRDCGSGQGTSGVLSLGALSLPWYRLFCQWPLPCASSEGLAASMCTLLGGLNWHVRNSAAQTLERPHGEGTWGDHVGRTHGKTTWGGHMEGPQRERAVNLAREKGSSNPIQKCVFSRDS